MRESSDKKKNEIIQKKNFSNKSEVHTTDTNESKLQLNIRVFCSRVSYGPDLKTNKKNQWRNEHLVHWGIY